MLLSLRRKSKLKRFKIRYDLHSSWTPWSVLQDGSNSCICYCLL